MPSIVYIVGEETLLNRAAAARAVADLLGTINNVESKTVPVDGGRMLDRHAVVRRFNGRTSSLPLGERIASVTSALEGDTREAFEGVSRSYKAQLAVGQPDTRGYTL